ncbi:unnamed protein product [Caenorhabditis angaria]|uniref:Uncharacterized protein n=1 Tax=Caenorhabditis angaria TaxID=860376 RepID=A0A9P1N3H2_9PELO|nr:unnamed protein product [Caenorhabditis angaria]
MSQVEHVFKINSERVKNLNRLHRAAAFSLFRDLQLQDMKWNKKVVRSDYKVYDLNNRVIFYVSSTTAVRITKDAPFCLKVMNKDQKDVAKFIRSEPRNNARRNGLVSMFGCCAAARDVMDILDDESNLIARAIVHTDQLRGTHITIRDPDDQIIILVRKVKDQNDIFYVLDGTDRFLGEIRQKIISSGNATDNYKGVSSWFSPDLPIDIKLLFLAAVFLVEIDYFSDRDSWQIPFHTTEQDYLNPIIRTPPYHQKFRQVPQPKNKKKKKNPEEPVNASRSEKFKSSLIMPEIHHIKNFAPINAEPEKPEEKPEETAKTPEAAKEELLDMKGMKSNNFRNSGIKVLDYLVKQDEALKTSRCTPSVKPGYLKSLIPGKAPQKPEDIDEILEDYHKLIVPGLSHSNHPNFHSFYPAGNSFHCMLADLLGGHIGDSGFSWSANPALTELEILMMDWLGDMMGLPKELLLYPDGSRGGGCMQKSASDMVYLVMAAARNDILKQMKVTHPNENRNDLLPRLVAYTSTEAHSSIRKAAAMAMVRVKVLPTDDKYSLRGATLYNAIANDRNRGLIPFFVAATFGTTGPCSFDNIHEIGPICRDKGNLATQVRVLMRGIEWVDSFSTQPSKLAISVCDVCCLWVRDRFRLQAASVENQIEFSYKSLPTSRKFGALKMWLFLRTIGVENLQKQIREHIRLGQYMEEKLKKDIRFDVQNKVMLGLICFRVKADDNFNKVLLYKLNETGKISLASCTLGDRFVLRLCINTPKSTEADLDAAFDLICFETDALRPFQDRVEVMNEEELEEFIHLPMKTQMIYANASNTQLPQLTSFVSDAALMSPTKGAHSQENNQHTKKD